MELRLEGRQPSIRGGKAAGSGQPNAELGEGVGESVPLGGAEAWRDGEREESEKPKGRT